MKRHTVLLATAVASFGAASLAASCASTGERGPSGRSRNAIANEELMAVPHSSLYEAVRALRPRWLQARNSATLRDPMPQTPRVYLDGQPFGGIYDLRSLLPGDVGEVRYLSASDATTRFGTNHLAGAIIVTTRRR